jgi:hypothetical protein
MLNIARYEAFVDTACTKTPSKLAFFKNTTDLRSRLKSYGHRLKSKAQLTKLTLILYNLALTNI